jgi:hypothetical protein
VKETNKGEKGGELGKEGEAENEDCERNKKKEKRRKRGEGDVNCEGGNFKEV